MRTWGQGKADSGIAIKTTFPCKIGPSLYLLITSQFTTSISLKKIIWFKLIFSFRFENAVVKILPKKAS